MKKLSMNKTRWAAMLLCGALLLPLAACKPKETPPVSSNPTGSTGMTGTSTGSQMPTEDTTATGESNGGSTATNKTQAQKPTGNTAAKTTVGPTRAPVSVAVAKNLQPLTASDDAAFKSNPDRGFRGSTAVDVYAMSIQRNMRSYAKELIQSAMGQSDMNPLDTTMVMQNYFYLTGFNDRDITAKGLEAIQTFYEVQMEMGIKGQPRFCYIRNTDNVAGEDATQEITLRHIDQVAPVIKKVKDGIQAFSICFIGAWGEWHGDYYPHDKKVIATAVMEKLVIPNGLYGLIRLPEYKNLLKGTKVYDRIGVENDSIFGKIPDMGYGTGGLDEGTDQWAQLVKEAAYTPQEGELYWNSWLTENNVTVNGFKVIQQLSEHRFTTLSIHHSYLDMGSSNASAMGRWKKDAITQDWLKKNGILYDPNWFKDKNGKAVSRNVFEFIRDHVGYRIAPKSIKVTGNSRPSATIQIEMPLCNYGFSAAFNLESGFAILDKNNKVVSSVKSGSPEKWYSRNPDNYYGDARQLTHTLKANMKLPAAHGQYKLAFYLKNSLGQFARVSVQTDMVNGYHILHTFDI